MNHNLKLEIGDIVYLKTDSEQSERMLTGICIRQDGITYELSNGNAQSWHYDFEISLEKDIVKSLTYKDD